MATGRRTAHTRARGRRPARRAWWAPVLAATATGLIGLAFVPDLSPAGAPLAEDAASVAAVAPVAAGAPVGVAPAAPVGVAPAAPVGAGPAGAAPGPAAAALAASVPGAIVVPVPGGVAAPTFVVPRPVVVPGSVVPPYVPIGVPARTSPPLARCGGYSTPRHVVPGVVAGVGSATVSFPANSSAAVRSYRVQAVSQRLVAGRQPAPVVATAPQRAGCAPITVTVGGLVPGAPYVFWLEEETADPHYPVTRFVQVGSSAPVVIG